MRKELKTHLGEGRLVKLASLGMNASAVYLTLCYLHRNIEPGGQFNGWFGSKNLLQKEMRKLFGRSPGNTGMLEILEGMEKAGILSIDRRETYSVFQILPGDEG